MNSFLLNGFSPYKIFSLKNKSLKSAIGYFLFLVLLISFPLNLQIIRNNGWDLYGFSSNLEQNYPEWIPSELPGDIEISSNGMVYSDATPTVLQYIDSSQNLIYYVFDPESTYTVIGRSIVFTKDSIEYYNGELESTLSVSYRNISTPIYFSQLKLMTQSEAVHAFSGMLDEAFGGYTIFQSVLYYSSITLFLNILLVMVVSAIFIFVRIKYQKVTTFSENIRIVVASMTIPSILSFIVGLFELVDLSAFTVVIFQFITPIIAIVSIYKGSKIKDPSIKGL